MAEKVTIVGEGLVGSVLALQLARRNLEVSVLERRPDMRKEKVAGGRSINLALSTRGLHALRELGLDRVILERAIPMLGRVIHPVSGPLAFQPYGKDDSEHINSVSRAWLNATLMSYAERSRKVKIRFRQKVLGMDFKARKLLVQDEKSGRLFEAPAKTVLACDGASSAVRRDMAQLPRFELSQRHLDHGYKELLLPAGPDGSFLLRKNALHIWPRGSYMLIALPNFEGSFTCTLFLPHEGPLSFDSLKKPQDVRGFFQAQFPDVAALLPDLTEQFFANPTGAMVTVKCFPWSMEDKALLLGDAAHAIVPFYGQGMNCGFEDCTILGECLEQDGGKGRRPINWKKVFLDFTRQRKLNADAIAEMAVENFIEMRDKVADPRFLLEKQVEKELQARFPELYIPRYSLVTFSRLPYSLAQRAGTVESRILAELCRDVKNPEEVDYGRARELIERDLLPVLRNTND